MIKERDGYHPKGHLKPLSRHSGELSALTGQVDIGEYRQQCFPGLSQDIYNQAIANGLGQYLAPPQDFNYPADYQLRTGDFLTEVYTGTKPQQPQNFLPPVLMGKNDIIQIARLAQQAPGMATNPEYSLGRIIKNTKDGEIIVFLRKANRFNSDNSVLVIRRDEETGNFNFNTEQLGSDWEVEMGGAAKVNALRQSLDVITPGLGHNLIPPSDAVITDRPARYLHNEDPETPIKPESVLPVSIISELLARSYDFSQTRIIESRIDGAYAITAVAIKQQDGLTSKIIITDGARGLFFHETTITGPAKSSCGEVACPVKDRLFRPTYIRTSRLTWVQKSDETEPTMVYEDYAAPAWVHTFNGSISIIPNTDDKQTPVKKPKKTDKVTEVITIYHSRPVEIICSNGETITTANTPRAKEIISETSLPDHFQDTQRLALVFETYVDLVEVLNANGIPVLNTSVEEQLKIVDQILSSRSDPTTEVTDEEWDQLYPQMAEAMVRFTMENESRLEGIQITEELVKECLVRSRVRAAIKSPFGNIVLEEIIAREQKKQQDANTKK